MGIILTNMWTSEDYTVEEIDDGLFDYSSMELENMFVPEAKQQIETDAIGNTSISFNIILSEEHIKTIEEELDDYEKIALIYLLYDAPFVALQDMQLLCGGSSRHFIEDWVSSVRETDPKWRLKLVESLCIVQNFCILKRFDLSKDYLIERFIPYQAHTAFHVNKMKKYLYRVLEDLLSAKEAELRRLLAGEFPGIPNFPYLEMYFIYLEVEKIERKKIATLFKALEMDSEYDYLKQIYENERQSQQETISQLGPSSDIKRLGDKFDDRTKTNRPINVDETPSNRVRERTNSTTIAPAECHESGNIRSEIYQMDSNNPGICLIIENENFYTECEEEYKDLVINPEVKIDSRHGTNFDSDRLKKLFTRFGYDVRHYRDRTHVEIKQIVKSTAHNEVTLQHSSLFICFLSHGVEGKIIGSNSVPVEIRQIKDLLQSQQLVGKPKVLIMQSCQGQEIQKVAPKFVNCESALTTDGLPLQSHPPACDIFELWSSIPGYASIRNMHEGSWLIQLLCDTLENYSKAHFAEICTIVCNRVVTEKSWKVMVDGISEERKMVCNVNSTFLKNLYLPALRELED